MFKIHFNFSLSRHFFKTIFFPLSTDSMTYQQLPRENKDLTSLMHYKRAQIVMTYTGLAVAEEKEITFIQSSKTYAKFNMHMYGKHTLQSISSCLFLTAQCNCKPSPPIQPFPRSSLPPSLHPLPSPHPKPRTIYSSFQILCGLVRENLKQAYRTKERRN